MLAVKAPKEEEEEVQYDCGGSRELVDEEDEDPPSRLMPILRHFLSRQYWHWFRWC